MPGAQKTSRSRNFEFHQIFIACLVWEIWELQLQPLLVWFSKFGPHWHEMHCPLLSETIVLETTIYGGHREMDRRERPPLVKIPRHESDRIDDLSIEGPRIDLWRVAGHLQILDPTC